MRRVKLSPKEHREIFIEGAHALVSSVVKGRSGVLVRRFREVHRVLRGDFREAVLFALYTISKVVADGGSVVYLKAICDYLDFDNMEVGGVSSLGLLPIKETREAFNLLVDSVYEERLDRSDAELTYTIGMISDVAIKLSPFLDREILEKDFPVWVKKLTSRLPVNFKISCVMDSESVIDCIAHLSMLALYCKEVNVSTILPKGKDESGNLSA
jgi:hypothetical protein